MKKIVFTVTILDGNADFAERLVMDAKRQLTGAEVRLFSAPRGLNYSVESPMVEVRQGSSYKREYGQSGRALLKELCTNSE